MGQREPVSTTPQPEQIIKRLEEELRLLDCAGLLVAAAKLADVIDMLPSEIEAKQGRCGATQRSAQLKAMTKHSDIF